MVDDRQSLHFKKLFLTFARWKAAEAKNVKLVHVGFGKIMGDDGRPFKTRRSERRRRCKSTKTNRYAFVKQLTSSTAALLFFQGAQSR